MDRGRDPDTEHIEGMTARVGKDPPCPARQQRSPRRQPADRKPCQRPDMHQPHPARDWSCPNRAEVNRTIRSAPRHRTDSRRKLHDQPEEQDEHGQCVQPALTRQWTPNCAARPITTPRTKVTCQAKGLKNQPVEPELGKLRPSRWRPARSPARDRVPPAG